MATWYEDILRHYGDRGNMLDWGKEKYLNWLDDIAEEYDR